MPQIDDGHEIEVLIDQSKSKNRVRVVVDQETIQLAKTTPSAVSWAIKPDLRVVA
jgi:TusA-related sulfurtransferase